VQSIRSPFTLFLVFFALCFFVQHECPGIDENPYIGIFNQILSTPTIRKVLETSVITGNPGRLDRLSIIGCKVNLTQRINWLN